MNGATAKKPSAVYNYTAQIDFKTQTLVNLALGCDRGRKYLGLVQRWMKCSGPEWTCKRLKAIRTASLQLRGGNKLVARAIWQKESIAYNHSSLLPKGIIGEIVGCYVNAAKPQTIRRYDLVLRLYTCIQLDAVSLSQDKKAYASITGEGKDGFDWIKVDLLSQIIRDEIAPTLRPTLRPLGNPDLRRHAALKGRHVSQEALKRIALYDKLNTDCIDKTRTGKVVGLRDKPYGRTVLSLLDQVWLPDALKEHNPNEELRLVIERSKGETNNNRIAGHISFIQERGCKARVVAVPNAWIQWLMEPLHTALSNLAMQQVESCVHDQNNGAYFMQDALSKGKQIWCYDLSSATDRFPLELQLALLEGLGLGDYAEAIRDVSSANWVYRNSVHSLEYVSWKVGQPMGMYGSFPLFHLTHLCLLRVCTIIANNWKTRRGESIVSKSSCFRVLGDDVIITDPDVAQMYAKAMFWLGVELSESKTIISRNLGEFGGFVTTKTNIAGYASSYRPYKFEASGLRRKGKRKAVSELSVSFALGSRSTSLGDSRYYGKHFKDFSYDAFVKTLGLRYPDLSPMFGDEDSPGQRPEILDSHYLGSLWNTSCEMLHLDIDLDPPLWRTSREVFLGTPIQDAERNFETMAYTHDPLNGLSKDDLYAYKDVNPWEPSYQSDALYHAANGDFSSEQSKVYGYSTYKSEFESWCEEQPSVGSSATSSTVYEDTTSLF
jgi:hypothetical protein